VRAPRGERESYVGTRVLKTSEIRVASSGGACVRRVKNQSRDEKVPSTNGGGENVGVRRLGVALYLNNKFQGLLKTKGREAAGRELGG